MRIILGLCCLLAGHMLLPPITTAQEIRQTIRDYCTDKPFTYSPCDPWTRSKVFNLQTGHAGLFYNCDGEEDKRNSPYICWKTHYECDIPPRRGLWRGMKLDIAQVRQRIRDGAGACCNPGCGCLHCVKRKKQIQAQRCQTCQSDSAAACQCGSLAVAPTSIEPKEIEIGEVGAELTEIEKLSANNETKISLPPKFGLIKGNSNSLTALPSQTSQPAAEKPKSRFAKAIDQLIQIR